jgi:hypothetical protein
MTDNQNEKNKGFLQSIRGKNQKKKSKKKNKKKKKKKSLVGKPRRARKFPDEVKYATHERARYQKGDEPN